MAISAQPPLHSPDLCRGGGAAKRAVELTIANCNSLDNNVDNDSSRGSSAKREEETDQFTAYEGWINFKKLGIEYF